MRLEPFRRSRTAVIALLSQNDSYPRGMFRATIFNAMKRHLSAALILVALTCGNLAAATITTVTFSKSQLTISGSGFVGALTVTLGSQKLAVLSGTATKIVASMNPVPDQGSYRLVLKAGTKSTFAYVTVPSGTLLTGDCARSAFPGVGLFNTVWLIGDVPCNQGVHYPPNDGVPLVAGVLKHLTVTGYFAGTATVYVNNSPTAITCTLTDFPPSPLLGCSDIVNQVQVNAGDTLNLGVTPSDARAMTSVHGTLELQE